MAQNAVMVQVLAGLGLHRAMVRYADDFHRPHPNPLDRDGYALLDPCLNRSVLVRPSVAGRGLALSGSGWIELCQIFEDRSESTTRRAAIMDPLIDPMGVPQRIPGDVAGQPPAILLLWMHILEWALS